MYVHVLPLFTQHSEYPHAVKIIHHYNFSVLKEVSMLIQIIKFIQSTYIYIIIRNKIVA